MVVAIMWIYIRRGGSRISIFETASYNVSVIVSAGKRAMVARLIRHCISRSRAIYAGDVEVEGLVGVAVLECKGGILVQGICAVIRYLAERHLVCKRIGIGLDAILFGYFSGGRRPGDGSVFNTGTISSD